MTDEELQEETETIDPEKLVFYRKMMRQCGILAGFLAAFFVILLSFTLLSRNTWRNGLRKEIQQVFIDNGIPGEVSSWVKIRSVYSTEASVYSVNVAEGDELYAVIARVQTIYGPVPAVFLWNEGDEKAEFIAFSDTDSPMAKRIESASLNSQIAVWEKRIPKFVWSKRIPKFIKGVMR